MTYCTDSIGVSFKLTGWFKQRWKQTYHMQIEKKPADKHVRATPVHVCLQGGIFQDNRQMWSSLFYHLQFKPVLSPVKNVQNFQW